MFLHIKWWIIFPTVAQSCLTSCSFFFSSGVKKLDVTVPWANVYLPPSEYG